MKHIKLFGLLAAVCLVLSTVSCTKEGPGNKEQGGNQGQTETSLKGTTWATADLMGIGTLTFTFTDKDATLKRVAEGKTTTCTYPYTFSNGTMKTKAKLVSDQEQDVTGTVSGTTMNVTFSKGGNYIFGKK
jgi:hypothetical protein